MKKNVTVIVVRWLGEPPAGAAGGVEFETLEAADRD